MRFKFQTEAVIALTVCPVLFFASCKSTPTEAGGSEMQSMIDAGRASFFDDACWRCHTLGNEELPGNPDFANQGPDLATVGDRLTREEILESIVNPNAVIAEPATDHTDENARSKMPSFADALPVGTIHNLSFFLSANKSGLTKEDLTVAVTKENFDQEVNRAESLVLLDFWAEWCVPCHEIDPVLEKLAPEYAGRVKICKINVDDNPDLVADYVPDNIFPCLILMKNGELLDRQYGTDPKMEIEPFFHKWFGSYLVSTK